MGSFAVRSSNASPVDWRKSSFSWANSDCIEVASRSGGVVGVRDSKNPGGNTLVVGPVQWDAFVDRIRNGVDDPR
jgi:hypothetical protein